MWWAFIWLTTWLTALPANSSSWCCLRLCCGQLAHHWLIECIRTATAWHSTRQHSSAQQIVRQASILTGMLSANWQLSCTADDTAPLPLLCLCCQMQETALIRAAHNGHLAVVEHLLQSGADIGARDLVSVLFKASGVVKP